MGIISSTNLAHPECLLTGGPGRTPRCFSRRRQQDQPVVLIGGSYARYSSDLQDESSIEQQHRKCRERAAVDGIPIAPEFEFADKAVSGTKRVREGLQAMMEAAKARKFQVLYFESLSRLARESVITMPMLKELVYVHRVRIISVSEGIDSSQSNWDLMANFMAWVHEQYLKALRAAVLRGQEEGILNDWSVGHWCFGYGSEPIPGSEQGRRGRNARPRKKIIINAEHARWVNQIFDWFVNGRWSLDRIARELTKSGAPKDHRSSTPGWHHDYVKRVLRNEKYIGLWTWGKATNVRNPLTGVIAQEGRPAAEVAQWVRHRPDLRIIEDAQFLQAQAFLDEFESKWEASRNEEGRFKGPRPEPGTPRHLLEGIVKCAECGSTFQVSGAHGKYLGCAGYKRGVCSCKTQLPRSMAQEKILSVVHDKILANPTWTEAIVQETQKSWNEQQLKEPDERAALELQLQTVAQRHKRLLDMIENGAQDDGLLGRLQERQKEKRELETKLALLRNRSPSVSEPPTREWVLQKIQDLAQTLENGGPEAAIALRRLVGTVKVRTAETQGRLRKYFLGELRMPSADALMPVASPAFNGSGESAVLMIRFGKDPPWAAVSEAVKAEFDAKLDFESIAQKLQCPYSWVAKALDWWHAQRGLETPDCRSLRSRLDRPTKSDELMEQIQALREADVSMGEIADRLGCCREIVTAAIRMWYESRGLPVPDGRQRRREVRLRRQEMVNPPPTASNDL